jgi:TP901 family phage tail tape measure protein
MSDNTKYLEVVITANSSQFESKIDEINRRLNGLNSLDFSGGVSSAFQRAGTHLTHFGQNLANYMAVPLQQIKENVVAVGMEFESTMRNINSIIQLPEQQFSELNAEMQALGMNTRSGALGLAEAYYTLASSGYEGADAILVANVATLTAEAGLAELSTTTEALSAMLLSYGLRGEESALRASDALTRMVQVGVGSMNDFAQAIGYALPSAVNMGVSMEELSAIGAVVTQTTLDASKSFIQVNAVMRALSKPTDSLKEAFQQLGVASGEELIQKFGGLSNAIQGLVELTGRSNETMYSLFRDERGVRGALAMTNNVELFNEQLALFNSGLEGATTNAFAQQAETLSYKVDLLKSRIQGLGIAIYDQLAPVIKPIVDGFSALVMRITQLNPNIIKIIGVLGLLTVAIPPIIIGVGLLATGIGMLMSPIGLVVAGIVALAGVMGATLAPEIAKLLESVDTGVNELSTVPQDMVNAITSDPQTVSTNDLMTIEIVAGDTWWGIWQTQFMEQYNMNWTDFKALLESQDIDINIPLQIGDMYNIDPTPNQEIITTIQTAITASANEGLENLNSVPFITDLFDYTPLEAIEKVLGDFADTVNTTLTNVGSILNGLMTPLAQLGAIFLDINPLTIERVGYALNSFFETFSDALTGFISIAGGAIQIVTTLIGSIFMLIDGLISGDGEKAIQAFSNLFSGLFESLKSILEGLGILILTTLQGAFRAVNVNGMFDGVLTGIDEEIAKLSGTPIPLSITMSMDDITFTQQTNLYNLVDDLFADSYMNNGSSEGATALFNAFIENTDFASLAQNWTGTHQEFIDMMVATLESDMRSSNVTVDPSVLNAFYLQLVTNLASAEIALNPPTITFTRGGTAAGDDASTAGVGIGLLTQLLPTQEEIDTEANAFATNVATSVTEGIQTQFLNNPEVFNINTINNSFLIPIEQGFARVFGLEGTATIAYRDFTASVVTNTSSVGTALDSMLASVNTTLPTITSTLVSSFNIIALAIIGAKNALSDLSGGISNLLGLGNFTPHSTGLAYVPTDGYPALLHRGERVLTRDQNTEYRNMLATPMSTNSNSYNNGGNTSNVINISGVQDVDSLLRELKRRGIQL